MFKPGSIVGGGHWPGREAHPDFWPRPVRGAVLDICDVRAWAHSLDFPTDRPDPAQVMNLALRLRAEGRLEGRVPVAWDHGSHVQVCWERTAVLRPYEEDLKLWRAARALRADQLRHPRRRKPRSLRDFLPAAQRSLALG